MLTVIIMILLSITVGVAMKHWELLSEVGELEEEVGDTLNSDAYSDYASTVSVVTLADESAK